jgi:hypothetical protein
VAAENPLLPGWARVRWAHGGVNSYEVGAHQLYALHFANAPPGPVRHLRAEPARSVSGGGNGSSASIQLRWAAPSDKGTPELVRYVIRRDGVEVGSRPGSVTAFVDTDVVQGASHCYSVTACSEEASGPAVDVAQVYVPRSEDRLTLLKLTVDGEGMLRLGYGLANGGGMVFLDGGAVEEERWVHVGISMQGQSLRLHVDGGQKDQRTLTSPRWSTPPRPLYLAAFGQGADPWAGQLFDVRVWNVARPPLALRRCASSLPARYNGYSAGGYGVVNRSAHRFPSLRIDAPIRPDARAYYEVTIRSSGCLQIGWALPDFKPSTFFMGVGDDDRSWACDGLRMMKWHGAMPANPQPAGGSSQYSHGLPYGSQWMWKPGDTIGCLLDMVKGTMRFSFNGRDLGLAFQRYDPLLGRYRVRGPQEAPCYAATRVDAEVTARLPPGSVFVVTQTEASGAPDGLLWLRTHEGWVPQRAPRVGHPTSLTSTGATDSNTARGFSAFLVERLASKRPLHWCAGQEQCLFLDRLVAPGPLDGGRPPNHGSTALQRTLLAMHGYVLTVRGLQRRGEDEEDDEEGQEGVGLRAVLTQHLELDGDVGGVSIIVDVVCGARQSTIGGDEAAAGLWLDGCEVSVLPYASPPRLCVRGTGTHAEATLPTPSATQPTAPGMSEGCVLRLHLTLRRSGHSSARLLQSKGAGGGADASVSFFLPSFFRGDRLGTIAPRLRNGRNGPSSTSTASQDAMGEGGLALRNLAVFAGTGVMDLPAPVRLAELESEVRELASQRRKEKADGPMAGDAAQVELVWHDAAAGLCVWAPELSGSTVFFGHALSFASPEVPPRMMVCVEHPSLASPVGFDRVELSDSPAIGPSGPRLFAWLPRPPTDEWVALGLVFTTDDHPPHYVPGLRLLHRSATHRLDGYEPALLGLCRDPMLGTLLPLANLRHLTLRVEEREGEAEEKQAASGRWAHLMPAMSCSEEEGLTFNLGAEGFKHAPPSGYVPLCEAVAAHGTLALQVFSSERQDWEAVRGAHGLRDGPAGEDDRLLARFLLNEGQGTQCTNAVYVRHTPDGPVLPFPAAAIEGRGFDWRKDVASAVEEEAGAVWGYKLSIVPHFPTDLSQGGARLREAFGRYVASQHGGHRSGALDCQLVRYVNHACRRRGITRATLLSTDWPALAPRVEELVAWPMLAQAMAPPPAPQAVTPPSASGPLAIDDVTLQLDDDAEEGSSHGPTWVLLTSGTPLPPLPSPERPGLTASGGSLRRSSTGGSLSGSGNSLSGSHGSNASGPVLVSVLTVELRASPKISGDVAASLHVGRRLRLLSSVEGEGGSRWAHVDAGGVKGYVPMAHIHPLAPQACTDLFLHSSEAVEGEVGLEGGMWQVLRPGGSTAAINNVLTPRATASPGSTVGWVGVGGRDSGPRVAENQALVFAASPCTLLVSQPGFAPAPGSPTAIPPSPKAVSVSGRWTVGTATDMVGIVLRSTGFVRSRDVGLADGLACCFRPVDGSLHVLAPPFTAARYVSSCVWHLPRLIGDA